MNISLKIENPNKKNKDTYLYVRLRTSLKNGKRTENSISTGIKISRNHFVKGSLSPRVPNYTNKQRIINSILDDIEMIISNLKEQGLEPNPSLIKNLYEEKLEHKKEITPVFKTFWSCFEEYVSTKKHTTEGYKRSLRTFKNRLKDFEKYRGKQITFDYIIGKTILFQNEIQDYFWEEKNLSNGYVNKIISRISNFLNYCLYQGYIQKKPKFQKNETVDKEEKIFLYREEVMKLFGSKKWDFTKTKDFSSNPHIIIIEEKLEGTRGKEFGNFLRITNWELVKDIFLFQCSIGCRYSDINGFKVRHFSFEKENSIFTWIQQKTNQRVSVPVNTISGSIFEKYSRGKSLKQNLFPPLSNQKFNKTIKYLFKDLNFNRLLTNPKKIGSKVVDKEEKFLWEVISSHSGRRTFIKNLIELGTMDYKTIMKLSGHKSLSEFQKYISVTKNDLIKSKDLFKSDTNSKILEEEELVNLYSKLSETNKKIVIQLIRNLKE